MSALEPFRKGQPQVRAEMTPEEKRVETRAAALQIPVELVRGLDIIDRELRAGQFTAARGSIRVLRELVHVQENVIRKLLTEENMS